MSAIDQDGTYPNHKVKFQISPSNNPQDILDKFQINPDTGEVRTKTSFDREEKDTYCPSNGGNPVQHECCGGHDAPWYWINTNSNQCCPNGQSGVVMGANDQC